MFPSKYSFHCTELHWSDLADQQCEKKCLLIPYKNADVTSVGRSGTKGSPSCVEFSESEYLGASKGKDAQLKSQINEHFNCDLVFRKWQITVQAS